MRRLFPAIVCLGALLGACEDLSGYRGDFDGTIVNGNFVRSCFPSNTEATLHFDPDRATGDVGELPESSLNWLTTSDGAFDRTPLEPIQKLADDQLSQFDFPGPKRLRNYMMLARPKQGPLANRDAMVVVSLLEDERFEVRVIARTERSTQACARESDAGAPLDGGTASDGGIVSPQSESDDPDEYFGIFRLTSK